MTFRYNTLNPGRTPFKKKNLFISLCELQNWHTRQEAGETSASSMRVITSTLLVQINNKPTTMQLHHVIL